jgi:hypothetical protein
MFLQVHVHVDSPNAMVSIPDEAQRPSGEVWAMRDGRLVILRPRAIQAAGGRLVFDASTSGLVAGDRVVVSPITTPRNGMAIVETNASGDRPAAQVVTQDAEDAT